jgi:hypothetical protein
MVKEALNFLSENAENIEIISANPVQGCLKKYDAEVCFSFPDEKTRDDFLILINQTLVDCF